MRICFITTEFVSEPYFSGGVAQLFYKVAKWQVRQGHEVHVITWSDKDGSMDYDGVHVHRISLPRMSRPIWAINQLTRWRLGDTINRLRLGFLAYRKARELHQRVGFDIVQSVNSHGCGLFTLLLLSLPHIVHVSCYRPVWNELAGIERTLDVRASEFVEWIYYRLSQHIYAASELMRQMLAEKGGIRVEKVIRHPVYLEVSELDPSLYEQHLAGKTYLLFFGRLQMHKGVHILGQALPTVFETCPDLHAAFVGLDSSSEHGPSMRAYIRSLCADHLDRLIFLDQTPHDQLYPIIQHARLVVLPSLVENMSNVVPESMLLGRPVIGTTGSSVDELIVDGVTGFLVPPGDPEALAEKIIQVWGRNDLDDIGAAARAYIGNMAPEKVMNELMEYYHHVIQVYHSS